MTVPKGAKLTPRFNLAPGQAAAVVSAGSKGPTLDFCMWGLIPSWAKDPRIGYKMINARVETLWEKASYRNPLRYRRCLVPANGFYEWKAETGRKSKTPSYFTVTTEPLFAFAGLWEIWNDRDGGAVHSFTLITRPANPFMRSYHDRMPLILKPEQEADWLDHQLYRPEDLKPMLSGGADVTLRAQSVSTKVNSAAYDEPDCVDPVSAEKPDTGWLF